MKKFVTISLLILAFIMQSSLYAQKQTYNWYFGFGAGITFKPNGNNPEALTDCNDTFGYATASISDSNGNLLFYTTPDNIYDKNHNLMQGGFDLKVDDAMSEALTIVPVPGTISKYYIFRIIVYNNGNIRYSIVDMHKNMGKGAVVIKDILLNGNRSSTFSPSVNIEAVKHRNNRDIWLVTRPQNPSNRFSVYRITRNGIVDSVISNVGESNYLRAFINSSPDGTKLATANAGDGSFEVFDFNDSTGVVSNPILLKSGLFLQPEAVEFSYDGTKLYGSFSGNSAGPYSKILQFDLNEGTADKILASVVTIDSNTSGWAVYDMQIGPDHKIYTSVPEYQYLGVINNPNVKGTDCNFVRDGVDLLGRYCSYGLPDFLYDYHNYIFDSNSPVCIGDTLFLYAGFESGAVYNWTGPDNFSSNNQNPFIANASTDMAGWYKVHVTNIDNPYYDSIYVVVNIPPVAKITIAGDSIICKGDTVQLKASPSGSTYQYLWSSGDTSSTINGSKTGRYWVRVTNASGCFDSAFVYIRVDTVVAEITSSGQTTFCDGDSVVLKALPQGSGYKYKWSTGETKDSIKVKTGGNYFVVVTDKNGCFDTASIKVTVNLSPDVKITHQGKTTFCVGSFVILKASPDLPDNSYLWSTGSIYSQIVVKDSGMYYLTITGKFGCITKDSIKITVIPNPKAEINALGSLNICDGDSVILIGSPNSTDYTLRWSTGEVSEKITVKKSGMYGYVVTNAGGCSDTAWVEVKVNTLPDVRIKADGSLCVDGKVRLSSIFSYPSYQWSTGDTTKSITVTNPGTYWLKAVNNQNCPACDTIEINSSNLPDVGILANGTLMGNISVCEGDTVILSAQPQGKDYSFIWSTGETGQIIKVTLAGEYKVIVKNIGGCEDSASIKITVNPKPIINITGDSVICNGRTSILLVQNESGQNDFQSYLWNTGETTKQISINKAGIYSVSVTDSNGCIVSASFEVKEYQVNLTGRKDLDFGAIQVSSQSGNGQTRMFVLQNESNTDVEILNIYTKNNTPEFSITSNPNVPTKLNPGGTIDITVSFKPTEIKDYWDSLIVESDKPCSLILSSEIKGKGIGTDTIVQILKSYIYLPDTLAMIADSNFCIPLRARNNDTIKINEKLNFTAEIRYDASALLPNTNYPVEAGDRVIQLSGDSILLTNKDLELGNFCGLVMIANQNVTPLRITKFDWSNPKTEKTIKDGKLSVKGICQPDLARIRLFTPLQLQIIPNPSNELSVISYKLSVEGNVKLTLVSLLGQEVAVLKDGFEEAGEHNYELQITNYELNTGMYFVRLVAGGMVESEKILIIK